ncbi:lactate 2-monooxygenase [Actinomadura madurae]|uniref:lactate 2-monooxygenase n=1 Tax=Actinomadura madurae TaxID=1993 RepID=UPI0020261998|nr:lactate 2-monooxygenase [Actinomadura madurae]MCP9949432.1 lactate 2-monooxygenase [Actinomadura madurae]MCP9966183.1 lactate 2-monooxygenase [Actinomadura madurae]MCP9978674.1 lactate 2-monooxygenase [Actinomadura madurae]MCQ0009805.1 lactate 2-monooxygenase [Actinomadura madurae]MCQ0014872.1 lactate 2-monooxygenase [Actinomadura madurae]
MSGLADFQNSIYLQGLGDVRPALPTDLTRLEGLAERSLSARAFGYVAGAAGSEATARANRAAFDRWRIVPRMLRDVAERDLSVTVLGTAMPSPVLLAPIGVQSILHPDGELAVARAAATEGLTMVLSTAASYNIEDVADANGDGARWYQLYWPKDRELAISFLERARAAGYTALVVTLDTFTMAWRPRDLDQAYLPFLKGSGVANYFSDPVFQKAVGGPVTGANRDTALLHWVANFGNPSLTWDDLIFLREHWDGPIALKGIQHPDDARQAVDAGMDGVIVSNHGGRQVDGAIASLDALPGVVDAVRDQATVLFDSGIRTGSDIAKALALGAKAVLVARPYAYGLALGGQAGVQHVLRCLQAELELTMALSGVRRPDDLTPDILVRA